MNYVVTFHEMTYFDVLNHSDLYVSVADYEGLPMALMEALAIGKPCLASDIASHHEIKCLVPTLQLIPFDEAAWVDAIQRFIYTNSREREQIGKSNRASIRRVFNNAVYAGSIS